MAATTRSKRSTTTRSKPSTGMRRTGATMGAKRSKPSKKKGY